jgi:hypothetical protein
LNLDHSVLSVEPIEAYKQAISVFLTKRHKHLSAVDLTVNLL